jgi:hypothetical protein
LALLGQPLLLDDLEDRNNVHEVFLVVPMGVDGHAEVGSVRKLDLEDLGFLGMMISTTGTYRMGGR